MTFPENKATAGEIFALVAYVPEPLGPFLDQLRQTLPGIEFAQAHITLLPPRPLRVNVQAASHIAKDVLSQFPAFEVELNSVRRFPETNVLYLDLTDGNDTVLELHQALNTGDLHCVEQFDFHPHLTLGGPIPAGSLTAMQHKAENTWKSSAPNRRFPIDEVVALWANPGGAGLEWQRLWTYHLGLNRTRRASATTTGRKL